MLPMILIPLFVLYGLSWILFAFVDPPYFISRMYYTPGPLFFLGDRTARLLIGILLGVVGPLVTGMVLL
jgi:hypothetical protein